MLMFNGTQIISANSGDSRAILVSSDPEKPNSVAHMTVTAISRDHKPEETDEYNRIIIRGGRVEPFKDMNGDPMGPLRIWLKNEDVPGLAMTRSIGDLVA